MRFSYSPQPPDFKSTLDFAGETLTQVIHNISEYSTEEKFDSPYCFLSYPRSEKYVNAELQKVSSLRDKLKVVFVVGIGGANLASRAINDALSKNEGDKLKAVYLDTTNSFSTKEIDEIISKLNAKDELVVCILSKSGATIEMIVNAELLLSQLESKFGEIDERIIITTDRDSPLWMKFSGTKTHIFETPKALGDRFSAFALNTLIPLYLLGHDVKSFLVGAKEMSDQCLKLSVTENYAFMSATILYYQSLKDKDILDISLFHPRLETLGKWYRQLFAESLGKEKTTTNIKVMPVYTPVVSVGTTDLHSMLQLNLAQPDKRLTHFVLTEGEGGELLPDSKSLGDLDSKFVGKTQSQITKIIYDSVKLSYDIHKMPYMETILPVVSEKSLGEYMICSMFSIVYLGRLMGVNVFDQPNVEEYKERARTLLEE
jgi:glucose-6-phosphate isomerase